jgi:riboflavin synthase
MFTGLVEARGEIVELRRTAAFCLIRIAAAMNLEDVSPGDSIAVDGACLTVVAVSGAAGCFEAEISPETLRVTTLGRLKARDRVNLEKALRVGSRLGGHFVLGHVDCVGRVLENTSVGPGRLMTFRADSGKYLVEKGSIAVDGVSLTINKVDGDRFSVMIIPHTNALTGLTNKRPNDRVNLEYDVIGKYVEKLAAPFSAQGLGESKLKDLGFI